MAFSVKSPDGQAIQFPDDATDDEVLEFMNQQFPAEPPQAEPAVPQIGPAVAPEVPSGPVNVEQQRLQEQGVQRVEAEPAIQQQPGLAIPPEPAVSHEVADVPTLDQRTDVQKEGFQLGVANIVKAAEAFGIPPNVTQAVVNTEAGRGVIEGVLQKGATIPDALSALADISPEFHAFRAKVSGTEPPPPPSKEPNILDIAGKTLSEAAKVVPPAAVDSFEKIRSLSDLGKWLSRGAGRELSTIAGLVGAGLTGGTGAAAAAAGVLETGGTARSIQEETGQKASDVALAAGTANAALELLPFFRLIKRMGIPAAAGFKSWAIRKFKNAGIQSVEEALTEFPQTANELLAVEWVKENQDNVDKGTFDRLVGAVKATFTDKDKLLQMFNAAGLGAFIGGGIGLAAPVQVDPKQLLREQIREGTERDAQLIERISELDQPIEPAPPAAERQAIVESAPQSAELGEFEAQLERDFPGITERTAAKVAQERPQDRVPETTATEASLEATDPGIQAVSPIEEVISGDTETRLIEGDYTPISIHLIQKDAREQGLHIEPLPAKDIVDEDGFSVPGHPGYVIAKTPELAKARVAELVEAQAAEAPSEVAPQPIPTEPTGSIAPFQPEPTEQVEIERGVEGGFAAIPGGRTTQIVTRPVITPESVRSPKEHVERFYKRTARLNNPRAGIKRAFATLKLGIEERFKTLPHIPRTPETTFARDSIRTMLEIPRQAKQRAFDDVSGYISGDEENVVRSALNNDEYDLFRQKLFTEDYLVEAETGIAEADQARQDLVATGETLSDEEWLRIAEHRLPEGITSQDLQEEKTRIDGLMAQSPALLDAYRIRRDLWMEVSQDLFERGIISEEAAANPHYVRHIVLDFVDDNISTGKGAGKRLQAPYRPYARERKGTRRDVSTDLLEVELKALADIYADNMIQDAAEEIAQNYAIEGWTPGDPLPEGAAEWQYQRGNIFFPAKTVTEKDISRLIESGVETLTESGELAIPESLLKDALVVGGKRKTFAIPQWLADQLNDLPVRHQSSNAVSFINRPVQFWKRWILRTNPIRYNLRNFLGDAERLNAAGRTRAFKRIPEAARILFRKGSDDPITQKAYERALELGVIGNSLYLEMGEARKQREFEQLQGVKDMSSLERIGKVLSFPLKVASKGGQVLQDMTQFREDTLRMALYLDALDDTNQFLQDGTPIRHWAGFQDQIHALAQQDPFRAAGRISRETLGDYGNFTPWENDFLRQNIMPFYSWMKINTRFWPRVVKSAATEGAGKRAAVGVALKTGAVAVRASTWLTRVLTAYAALMLWNNRDEEAQKRERALLSEKPWLAGRPHLTLDDGVVHTPSALGDFMEWFGLDEIVPILRRFEANQLSTEEFIIELMKHSARAPVNRVIASLSPFLKGAVRVGAGTKIGFEAFKPIYFHDAWTSKAAGDAVLELLGSDVRRFLNVANGRRTLVEVLAFYMSGSSVTIVDDEQLSEQLLNRLERSALKQRSPTTGRGAGEAKKGKEEDLLLAQQGIRALRERKRLQNESTR